MNKQEQRTFGITENLLKKPVPRFYGAGKHKVQLAYITPDEANLLADLDLHGSNPPNPGPGGIPNFNDPGTGMSGAQASAAERDPRDRSRREQRDLAVGSSFGPSFGGGQGPSGQPGFTQADVAGIAAGAQAAAQGQAFQDAQGTAAQAAANQAAAQAAANQATTGNVFTQGISNIYNKFINNPYTQTTSSTLFDPGLALAFGMPPMNLGTAFLGFTGINPQFDDDDKLTSMGLFGSEYGGLKNALNPLNYEDVAKEDFDAMLDAAFSPDPDSTKGYKVDFDAAEAEAQKLGFGPQFRFESNPVFGEDDPSTPESESFNPESSVVKDLEKNLGLDDGSIDNFKDFADAKRELDRKTGGGDQRGSPANLVSNQDTGAGGGTGGDTGTNISTAYNDFTEAQKSTVDKMTGVLGYDTQYAINYILGGGPTF